MTAVQHIALAIAAGSLTLSVLAAVAPERSDDANADTQNTSMLVAAACVAFIVLVAL